MKKTIPLILLSLMLGGCGGGDSENTNSTKDIEVSAGQDINAYGKKTVTLTPSYNNISDPTVKWEASTENTIEAETQAGEANALLVTLPDLYNEATLKYQITIADKEGNSATDEVTINVIPAEHTLALALTGLGANQKVTNQASPTLEGIYNSDYQLKSLTILNETSGDQTDVEISPSWSSPVELAEGDNNIIVTAISDDDTALSISAVITYYPDSDFTTPLQMDKSLLYVGEAATDIRVMIGTSNSNNPTVKLLDDEGNEIAQLNDNGQLPDEIDGDGLFTAVFSAQAETAGEICYRVSVSDNVAPEYMSEQQCLWGVTPYSNQQTTVAVDNANDIKSLIDSKVADGEEASSAAVTSIKDIEAIEGIAVAGATPDGGLWWVNDSGILGLYHSVNEGTKSGVSRGGIIGDTPTLEAPFEAQYYASEPLAKSRLASSKSTPITNRIKSSRAVIISPYIDNPNASGNFGQNDDYFSVWQTLKNENSCKLEADTSYVNDGSMGVSLDNFKDFSAFGYIHLSTHGDNYYNGLLSLWQDVWGPNNFLQGGLSIVGVSTGIKLPKNNDGSYDLTGYQSDLQAKRLALGPDGSIVALPSFFAHYMSTIPNSLVSLSSCRSMYNNSLANVFMSKGAGAVMGYDNYVSTSYAQGTTNTILTDMLNNDSTFADAVQVAINTHGAVDKAPYFSKLKTIGAADLQLPAGGFENLDFELGGLGPWLTEGDGRVITQLGATPPTQGQFMGVVSTGLGYTTTSGQISQQACLDSSATSLSFDWNLFSEEFMEYCNSPYDDSFSVSLCEADDGNCVKFETSINQLCNSDIPLTSSDVSFDRGDVYDTGWQNEALNISSLAGKKVELKVFASDVGDSIYDTAILVDNIRVE